jgi:DNA repair exonuclease SbcCD ATPase subunit
MIIFKKIKFKNFLSYGNTWTEFEFESGVVRLSGQNGSGKSVIGNEALYFVLFGKTYRKINLPQLVNSVNKSDLRVELYFTIGQDEYKVIRGLKPNIFEIYENNELKPLSSTKSSYQQILEEILHLNENVFNQTTCKSVTKNISFLSLSKFERRNVIEGIFDIEMFSSMSKICKTKYDDIDFKCNELRREIEYINMLIEQELENIQNLKKIKQQMSEESKRKVDEITNEINDLTNNIQTNKEALSKLKAYYTRKDNTEKSINGNKQKVKLGRDKYTEILSIIKASQQKIEMFSSVCAGCLKIQTIIDSENIEIQQNNLALIEEKIEEIRNKNEVLDKELKKINQILASEHYIKANIDRDESKIKDLNKSIYVELNKEIEIDETKLKSHTGNKKEIETRYNTLTDDRKHYAIMKNLLSDDGIKSFVIKRYLPHVNKLLNTYLQKFGTEILFYFDSEFNEVVASRHKESFSYFSFSEGQKRRIDLAILFAFIEFSKIRNKKSNSNLMIFDEINTTLDPQGENIFYEILKDIAKRENKCIIIISHSGNIDPERIDTLYEITLEKGFSKVKKVEN